MGRELQANEVRTGMVRFTYCHLFEPKTPKGGTKPIYSTGIIIPKSDTATLQAIKGAIEAAKKNGIEKKWGGKAPANLTIAVHDGDVKYPGDPIYAKSFVINIKSDRQPGIVDAGTPPTKITDPNEFYSGCYGRAFFQTYAFDTNGNKGIGFGLQHVQKLKDGERLAGGVSVESAFDDWGGQPESIDDLPF